MPPLRAVLKDSVGAALDLTDSSVRFIMAAKDKTVKAIGQCAILDPPNAGRVEYQWRPQDTDEVGTFHAEFEVTFLGGRILTVPNDTFVQVNIIQDLG